MNRKFLSVLLALVMILSLAAPAMAAEQFVSGDWAYEINGDGLVLTQYLGSDTDVTVPATIDGKEVYGVGTVFHVFSDVAETMTSVTLEEGIQNIGTRTFRNCTALKTVNIPSSVTYIGTYAFEGCTSLTELNLEEGLRTINSYAFYHTGLTSVAIPASVTDIGDYAFGWYGYDQEGVWTREHLDEFTLYGYTDTAAEEYANHNYFVNFIDLGSNYDNAGRCGDGLFWEFTAATGTLRIYGAGGYMEMYGEVEEIPWYLHMPFITNAVIEDAVNVCDYAFYGCPNLTTVTMEDTVVHLVQMAFAYTPKLANVKLSANLETISYGAFQNSGLTTIDIPESVYSIGSYAFAHSAITAIDIPDAVDKIPQATFMNCKDLKTVELPDSLVGLGINAFADCTALRSIDFPDGLMYISMQAFSGSGLERAELPDSVIAIGDNAFHQCQELRYVKLPPILEEIGWRCFSECPKLETIVMPEGLDLAYSAYLFLDCDSLTDLSFHTAAVIGDYMYQDCDGLVNVTIPACVTKLGQHAFAYCDRLAYVTIPQSITELGHNVFYSCPTLSAIAFRGDAPSFTELSFRDTTVTCYYPADNATWTEEVLQNYGGNVTWKPYEVLPFTDVPVNSFYHESVAWAVELGVTNGIDDSHFGPNASCNRAQVVTFLWRAAGSPDPIATEHPFVDVEKGSFYEKAVLWAVEKGVTNGIDDTHFGPNLSCNRAQVVTFLYRAQENPSYTNTDCPFTDVVAGQWYEAPILWAVEKGVTNGMGDGTFGVNNTCNRAQVVTFLHRTYVN